MSKIVIFPVGKEAAAESYADACNSHYAGLPDKEGTFTYLRPDRFGQMVVGYYGEVVDGEPFEEPTETLALRADGVLHETVLWPEEE